MMNHHEISFSKISESIKIDLNELKCVNEKTYKERIPNTTSGGCYRFNEIKQLDLNVFISENMKSYDSSLFSVIN